MGGENRGSAMAASLGRTARSFGVNPEGVRMLSRAHALAMERRVAELEDDHHPVYLHPGRSALILLRDAGVTDAVVLSAAAVTESEDARFRVTSAEVRGGLGEEVHALVAAVPLPDSESLLEELVTASEPVRLVALAERLDHFRHAHLRDAEEGWRIAAHAQAGAVYLPVAERTHPRLAQRYRHWWTAFGRRLTRG